jgi:hypothetical protein
MAALLIVTSAQPGWALDLNQWVPGLQVTPFLSQRVEYESNVFQTSSHSQDDVIFKTIPGALAEWVVGQHSLSAGYRAEILKFLRLTDRDTIHHFLAAQLVLEFSRLRISVRDDFAHTSDPPTNELTGRVESTSNTLVSEARYRLTERFAAGINGSWARVSVPTFTQLDRNELVAGASVFWRVTGKADLQLNYNHGDASFDEAFSFRDYTRNVILVGLRGDVTPKLASTFRLGWESREPKSSVRGLPSYNGIVIGGDWIYKPTERLTLSLLTDRSVQESVFNDQLFYVSTSATIIAAHQFGSKVLASLRFTGGENVYPRKETVNGQTKYRQDTFLAWGGAVSYDIQKWLRVGADYIHTLRSSNFKVFDYQDDKVGVFATLQL